MSRVVNFVKPELTRVNLDDMSSLQGNVIQMMSKLHPGNDSGIVSALRDLTAKSGHDLNQIYKNTTETIVDRLGFAESSIYITARHDKTHRLVSTSQMARLSFRESEGTHEHELNSLLPIMKDVVTTSCPEILDNKIIAPVPVAASAFSGVLVATNESVCSYDDLHKIELVSLVLAKLIDQSLLRDQLS